MIVERATVKTPLGSAELFAAEGKLVGLEFSDNRRALERTRQRLRRAFGECEEREVRDPAGAATRLRRYFDGDLGALAEQPVASHGTDFQLAVWKALRRIRPGRTLSYGEVARAIGQPTAVRAVGAANGANPISLFVPCHRVLASNGSLHGYGGGLDRKRWLLEHEGALAR